MIFKLAKLLSKIAPLVFVISIFASITIIVVRWRNAGEYNELKLIDVCYGDDLLLADFEIPHNTTIRNQIGNTVRYEVGLGLNQCDRESIYTELHSHIGETLWVRHVSGRYTSYVSCIENMYGCRIPNNNKLCKDHDHRVFTHWIITIPLIGLILFIYSIRINEYLHRKEEQQGLEN